ncbi:MAG: DNA-deoxyinosine glycosylase [Clostridia bacterium]|nr:DNA-deoxyinosine glycosylase [Clostridia bacterium]
MIVHPIPPLFDKNSEILILGSFPSVKSREECFFYGHPQNRFWKIIARILNEKTPETIQEKKALMLRHKIAMWDVIHSCEIEGSADSTIKNVVPNDLSIILKTAKIKRIYVNGKKAEAMYKKYTEKEIGIKATVLPSTSPANAAWNEDRLFEEWKKIVYE